MSFWLIACLSLGTLILCMAATSRIKRPKSRYEDKPKEKNSMEGKIVRFIEDDTEEENADGV